MNIEQKGGIEFETLGKRLYEIYVKTIAQAQRAPSEIRFNTKGSENKCSRDNLLCYLDSSVGRELLGMSRTGRLYLQDLS